MSRPKKRASPRTQKEFVVLIRYTGDPENLNLEDVLDALRANGAAEIVDITTQEKRT